MIRDSEIACSESAREFTKLGMAWIRRSIATLSLIILAIGFSHAVAGQAAPPQKHDVPIIQLGPCARTGIYPDALCGNLEVFENRTTKMGRKISLNIAVLPALNKDPNPDPVFMLAGGPGQGAADVYLAGARKDQVAAIRAYRDIVLVDQRGTGGSHALPCVLYPREAGMRAFFGDYFPADIVRACRELLAKDADLTQYTTPIAMDDLDEVRAALGYDRINLQGGSYGTRAALVYMRQHPDNVRAAVLEGVAPTNYKLPLPGARAVDHALDRLIEDCQAEPACHEAYPFLRADLTSVAVQMGKTSAKFQALNPATKKMEAIEMPRRAFMDRLVSLLYSPDTSRLLPYLIHHAGQGDFGPYASVVAGIVPQLEAGINRGMYFSVVCAEDLPWITDAEIKKETTGTLTGDERVLSGRAACKDWPRADISADFLKPVKSTAPILILSGDADPVAPYWIAEAAAKFLPNSRHIVVRYGAHTTSNPCLDRLITSFIEAGTVKSLDASCVNDFKRPPFLTDASVKPQIPPGGANSVPSETWQGVLQAGSSSLHLVLRIYRTPDAKLFALLDSPDQSTNGIKVDMISTEKGHMHLVISLFGASYDGEISADGHDVHGTWRQSGASLPLDFHLADAGSGPSKP